jgi:hypothetical protein
MIFHKQLSSSNAYNGWLRADDQVVIGSKCQTLGNVMLSELLEPFNTCATSSTSTTTTTTASPKVISVSYEQVLACYAATIRLLAGHNLYIDYNCREKKKNKTIRLPGINVAFMAQNDIVLPPFSSISDDNVNGHDTTATAKFQIDTSGRSGAPFQHSDALAGGAPDNKEGEAASAKKAAGLNGENGLDGFSGQKGGNVLMHALNGRIRNLNKEDNKKSERGGEGDIVEIRTNGGDGSGGQKGGSGQKGGGGEDMGDAIAYDFPACYLTPGFSMYVNTQTRQPRYM